MSRDQAPGEEGYRKFEDFLKHWSRRDFMKNISIGAAYTAFLAGGVEFMEACANAGSGNGPSVAAKKGGHLTQGSISDIKSMNPVLQSDTASAEVIGLLYDSLMNTTASGELRPLLAKELPKTSSDGLTYTITLRDNIKWTDGSPITADDVKFTYDLMFDPQYKAVNSPRRGDLETYVQSITVKDAKTVVFQLKKVYAPFAVNQLQYGILPKKVWGSLSPTDVNTTDLNTAPTVTSGIFKFQKWDNGQQVTLNRNDSYWQGAPYLYTFIYKVVADGVAIGNQLKTGEIDMGQIDPAVLADVQGNPDLQIVNFPVAIFTFYAYNQNATAKVAQMFSDKAVRQALLYAIDRQGMADSLYFKQAVVATSSMPPVAWAYNKDKILDDAVATLDQSKRKQLYFQMQDILNDEVPAPILVFNKGIWGMTKRVQGVTGGDFGLGTYTQFQNKAWMKSAFVADGK